MAAFLAICLGMARITWRAVASAGRHSLLPGSPRLHATIRAAVLLSPIVVAAAAQAYVSQVLKLPWVNLGWRARGAA
jgi:hypothetical protein